MNPMCRHQTIYRFLSLLATLFVLQSAQAWAFGSWQDGLYDKFGLEVYGFWENRIGVRLRNDPLEKDMSLGESRLQLEATKDLRWAYLKVKSNLTGDFVLEDVTAELRELNLQFSPFDIMDVKIGRQTLTWGTGDLIFINDMFPKDWQSFFIGRQDEYLKAPSDALKTSFFFDEINLDLVYTPIFNNSTYVSGERLSFYNPLAGGFSGRDSEMEDDERNSLRDGEFSGRLFRTINSTELALYGYSGFWKEPEGFDMSRGLAYYPRLSVYGGSARSTILGGVGSLEVGYYDSRANRNGDDPTNRNSEIRFLAGFARELAPELTGSVQYYLEWMQDYTSYELALKAMMPDSKPRDEYRHLLTLRLTKLAMNQNLTLSFFAYYSPSDHDGYIRPKASYKISDHWIVEGGANLFWGKDDHTFWGRFKKNNNVYTGLRYGF